MFRTLWILSAASACCVLQTTSGRGVADEPGLSALAEEAGGRFSAISPEQFTAIRAELRSAAGALDRSLSRNAELRANWRRYLRWSLLEPHFKEDAEITPGALNQLNSVLRRFRANEPGLELPIFVRTAQAIERYQSIAPWVESAATRSETASTYRQLLNAIGRELERHAEQPTPETALKLARAVEIVKDLGQAPAFVHAVRRRYAQPNLIALGSDDVIRRLGQRPVEQRQPVRDLILGTRIYGQSLTQGDVRMELAPDNDHVSMLVSMSGNAYAQTKGYNGPVVIRSRSTTAVSATAVVRISDRAFHAQGTSARASTDAQIQSICKTGGPFGRRLVQKLAWKRARQQQGLSERIASQHAAERLRSNFLEELNQTLAEVRHDYENNVRAPLIRRGATPAHLEFASTKSRARVETTFATRSQLAADRPPPASAPSADLCLQIHESAVGNYLTLALGGASVQQNAADAFPELGGDVPPWLAKLANRTPSRRDATGTAAGDHEQTPFKPWSITLNRAAPVSVQFDRQRLTIRIRAAFLSSDENQLQNWDFVVRYAISRRGNEIVLQREGPIEVFPTGFDPQWPSRLSAQQSGLRNTLAKNVNARAESGQGFPALIDIDAVDPPRVGKLELIQLEADGGWLTLGWRLP